MKNSLRKGLILAAVVAMLMAALAPGASAQSRGDSDKLAAAPAETKHEICIIEGANICPPEPFEIVFVCITTHLLAGETCPDMNEGRTGGGAETLTVATGDNGHQAALPQGDCVGVNTCNQFIADCIAAGGDFDEEHHNPQGEPNLGSCGPVQD